MDTDTDDIASSGFGNCLTRDGQGQATANLPMAGFRHTGVGNGANRSDYSALGQVQDGTPNWIAVGGTSDAITAVYSPALTALVDGQLCFARASAANGTTTPTFAPNGLTAHVITKTGGLAVGVGDIPGNLAEIILRYNLANTRWELLNPASGAGSQRTPVADAAYTLKVTDRLVAYTNITAARAVTLLAASAYPAGVRLLIVDESGLASKTNTITPTPNGTDDINGVNSGTAAAITAAYGWVMLESNGSNAWTIIGQDLSSQLGNLPTSLPASSGLIWNNGGVISIS